MPKIVSEEERTLTKEAIYDKTVTLIKEKGIRAVTVEDITGAVGIGKGSFYTYYRSKEICLFEVLRRCERELFSRLEETMALSHSDRDKAVHLLKAIYTDEDSIIPSLNQTDMEALLRKLPAEYRAMKKEKSDNYFQHALELMDLDNQQMEVVALLTDCLSYAAGSRAYGRSGTKKAIELLSDTIGDFIAQAGEDL